jgi:hypothetical protein
MIVGGYSVILHGYSRTTGDLDIWVSNSSENFKRLQSAFEIFGIPRGAIPEAEFHDSSLSDVFSFGRPPTAIDIMTSIKGLEFKEAYKRALTINIEKDFIVQVISKDDLITVKKASGRYRDLDDIENLEDNKD